MLNVIIRNTKPLHVQGALSSLLAAVPADELQPLLEALGDVQLVELMLRVHGDLLPLEGRGSDTVRYQAEIQCNNQISLHGAGVWRATRDVAVGVAAAGHVGATHAAAVGAVSARLHDSMMIGVNCRMLTACCAGAWGVRS